MTDLSSSIRTMKVLIKSQCSAWAFILTLCELVVAGTPPPACVRNVPAADLAPFRLNDEDFLFFASLRNASSIEVVLAGMTLHPFSTLKQSSPGSAKDFGHFIFMGMSTPTHITTNRFICVALL